MTQKELLYIEDAIGHESVLISVCDETINMLEDKDLISFMKKQIKSHTSIKESLMNILEVKSNE